MTGPAPLYQPATWSEALDAEVQGLGAIRFIGGRPHWFPGEPVRWREGDAVDEDFEAAQRVAGR